jgi:uncharacterized integral membrane protein (TIGR00698 family)
MPSPLTKITTATRDLVPGIALCVAISLVALGLTWIEAAIFGATWLEPLVMAILVGTVVRTLWAPGSTWRPGIAFSAKMLLEIAVFLLGAAISARSIAAAGPNTLVLGIALVVALGIVASYAIGRLLGLPAKMATLVACGNAICGNSAIAAVAPVIGAKPEDVTASIAFTAVLGVVAVLTLPLLAAPLGMSVEQYGVFAGLTVYAVPQVLAATAPMGPLAVQIGTLVKLVRVLMLGPVVLVLSLLIRRQQSAARRAAGQAPARLNISRLVPWFILGFLALAALRSLDLLPALLLRPIGAVTTAFTVLAMAALGLGTDLKILARAGGRVSLAVTISLLIMLTLAIALIRLLAVR